MPITELVWRWPLWYVALVAFCAYRGGQRLFESWRHRAAWQLAIEHAPAGSERARARGAWVGFFTVGCAFLAGSLLLLWGSNIARVLLALMLCAGAPRPAAEFARGMAEGRRAGELAASVEYVEGRVTPLAVDWMAAWIYVGTLQVLPAVVLLYSMTLP